MLVAAGEGPLDGEGGFMEGGAAKTKCRGTAGTLADCDLEPFLLA